MDTTREPAVLSVQETVTVQKRVLWQSVLLLLLVFLAFSRWTVGGDPLSPQTGTRAYVEIGMVVFAFVLMLFMWGPGVFFKSFRSSSFTILFAFGIWTVITVFWAGNPIMTLGKSIELLVIAFLGAGIASQSSAAGVSIVKTLLIALLLLIGFLFLVNIAYYHTPVPFRPYMNRARFVMGFDHPNTTVMFFSSVAILLSYLFFSSRDLYQRIWMVIGIVISLAFIYLTDSRTSMFSVLVAILLLALWKIRSKRVITSILLVFLIALTVVSLILVSGKFDRRINNFIANHQDFLTLNGRTGLWASAFETIDGANIGGLGYYNSRFLFLGSLGQGWGYNLHNSYLELFFTTGWIGLFFVILFYFSLAFLLPSIRTNPLPLIIFFYMSLEGIMESRLFIPTIPFLVAITLIFHQQFQVMNACLSPHSIVEQSSTGDLHA